MRLTQTLTSATQSTKQIPRSTRSSYPIPAQIQPHVPAAISASPRPAQSKSGVQGSLTSHPPLSSLELSQRR
ncbi:hypothetical protein BGZ61DRAFT_443838 [Ilyonectria robusta]|uniref:uncharacterized protein n=1 Tax=Ilyonectria robusta TaxID=1079257 RepID=UPI001E8ECDBA|nr:uncharacterized protein BGZ61DRAFT_443838 [Ilyonectria robusta]KAH8735170.1 hypothetical protein BGZ61DRAFT_443838 [Ilyonectria robusta]